MGFFGVFVLGPVLDVALNPSLTRNIHSWLCHAEGDTQHKLENKKQNASKWSIIDQRIVVSIYKHHFTSNFLCRIPRVNPRFPWI
jgi:hypothetical protein